MAKRNQIDGTTKFFITIIGLVVIGIVLRELSNIFIPLVIAIFLFFVFAPFNSWLTGKKVPMLFITLLDIAITFGLLYGVGRIVVDSFFQFSASLPFYGDKLSNMIKVTATSWGITDPFFTEFSIDNLLASLNIKNIAGGLFTSTISLLGNVLFVLFFFVFVLSGNKTIYEAIKHRYVNKKVSPQLKIIKKSLQRSNDAVDEQILLDKINQERTIREQQLEITFKKITEQIQRYIIAKFTVNLTAGIITTIVLAIIGVDFPIVWGLFVFLFNFIPTIGSAAALVFPVLFTLVQFDSFGTVILVLALMAGIQTLAFNVAEPMLLGKRLNLNPLLILLSVLVWGYIWGIVGMLLSVPLTAIIKIIISNSNSANMEFFEQLMSQEKL
ncbi:MAG: AI-2E family transporter [Ignavibacteriales bacterium]|nr:AI-2E family transporter [Ignavibacteriales bacterium]